MQKLFYVMCLFLLTINSNAQTSPFRCYITVSLTDCVNCLNASKVLLDIPKEFQPALVFKTQHKKQAPKIISEVMKLSWSENNVIVSDSLFSLLVPEAKPHSEVHILDKNNFKIFTCLLTKLNQDKNLDKIKNLTQIKKYDTQKVFPDSIITSARLNLKYSKGNRYIFAHDNLFNDLYILHKEDKTLFTIVNGKNIDKKEVYKGCFGDTAKYHERIVSQQKMLEKVGKTNIEITNFVDDKNGNIYLWLVLYYAIDSVQTKQTYIHAKTIFSEYQINKKYTYFNIDKIQNSIEFVKENYYGFGSQWDIYKENEKLYVMPAKQKPDTTTSVLAEINLDKNNFKLKKAYYPSVFRETEYLLMGYYVLPPYLFFENYPEFINFETGKKTKIMLGYEDGDFKKLSFKNTPFQLTGVFEKDNTFYAMITQKGEDFYIAIDKNGKIMFKKPIYLPDTNISAFNFIDKNKLIAINNDNMMITIEL